MGGPNLRDTSLSGWQDLGDALSEQRVQRKFSTGVGARKTVHDLLPICSYATTSSGRRQFPWHLDNKLHVQQESTFPSGKCKSWPQLNRTWACGIWGKVIAQCSARPGVSQASSSCVPLTPVGFEPAQLALVELESIPLDHSGKVSMVTS